MLLGLSNAIVKLPQNILGSVISAMFSNNEQGVWYDPSDMSTLFQDSAGTIPITAVEQPVGKILDKSGRGNHATQTTTTSRPVLSARYNLLTKTEQFDDAAWIKEGGTVALANNVVSFAAGANETNRLRQSVTVKKRDGISWTFAIRVPPVSGWSDPTAKLCLKSATSQTASFIAPTDKEQVVFFTETPTQTGTSVNFSLYADKAVTITGIWGADLRVTNDAAGQPAYQRVNTATDYDTTGFKPYLSFDGVDDYLSTGSIDFSSTDKMTVLAGVQKLSDAGGTATLFETSSSIINNNGTLFFGSPTTTNSYQFNSKGSSESIAGSGSGVYVAPITNVVAGISDISGDSVILRVNGNQVAQSTADQGTGNYGNYPLYIGRRGGTSLPFNGKLYGLVIRGALSSTGEIQGSESYMNLHTGAY